MEVGVARSVRDGVRPNHARSVIALPTEQWLMISFWSIHYYDQSQIILKLSISPHYPEEDLPGFINISIVMNTIREPGLITYSFSL